MLRGTLTILFKMIRFLRRALLVFTVLFLTPLAASTAWWLMQDRPQSWRAADWGPSGVLPPATADAEARIHVMAARTGGLKGAVSVHSWIVFKEAGARDWTRWEVVGWGTPLRRNAYAADAHWYSNAPDILATIEGEAATAAIPKLQAAIDAYPYSQRGDYTIWPGPNSNTFVGYLLRAVHELDATLPPHAVGKDWLGPGLQTERDAGGDWHLSWNGWVGGSFGSRTGVELHLLGQSLGVEWERPAVKLPGVGRLGV